MCTSDLGMAITVPIGIFCKSNIYYFVRFDLQQVGAKKIHTHRDAFGMKIFISYRRADSKYVVDRIRDRLIDVYDDDAIFRDLESIPLGQNFSNMLKEATTPLMSC